MIRVLEHEGGVVQFTMARRLLGRELYRASCYLVDGILVDTGMAHATTELLARLAGRPLRLIVNTHAHEDHIAGNAALQRRHQLPVLAHPLALEVIARPERLRLRPYQRLLFGTPEGSRAGAIPDRIPWSGGEFRVLHTPGHSPDHVALFEPERGWLFAGDAYLGGRERFLRDDCDAWGLIATYQALARLPLQVLFAGTGQVVRDPAARLERKLEHLGSLAQQVWALHDAGLEEREIARRLLGGDLLVRLLTSGHFSAPNLVRSLLTRRPDRPPALSCSAAAPRPPRR
jgi:glyoxylase-like metal-dependent hydrolase (beta-lactamase superfamily II)